MFGYVLLYTRISDTAAIRVLQLPTRSTGEAGQSDQKCGQDRSLIVSFILSFKYWLFSGTDSNVISYSNLKRAFGEDCLKYFKNNVKIPNLKTVQ